MKLKMKNKFMKLLKIFTIIFIIVSVFIQNNLRAKEMNFRKEMRDFVIFISKVSKNYNKKFLVIPQNALEIINGNKVLVKEYINAIDGVALEELYYGNPGDGIKNSNQTTKYFLKHLNPFKNYKKKILIIDYIKNKHQAKSSYLFSKRRNFISFQAERSLSKIPTWKFGHYENEIKKLKEVRNFLYILTVPEKYTKKKFLSSISKTNYDLLVIDAFFHGKIFTKQDLIKLKKKKSGKNRLVIAYLSIGEAETYRYYWNKTWKKNPPGFIEKENPEWQENFKVKYWMQDWKKIICGAKDGSGFETSYLKKILDAGFDGVYLDIVDAAFYFEKK